MTDTEYYLMKTHKLLFPEGVTPKDHNVALQQVYKELENYMAHAEDYILFLEHMVDKEGFGENR